MNTSTRKTSSLIISPLALITLSACKFGRNNNEIETSSAVSGNIVKGPLSNALVFLDLNDNNKQDENEQSIRTDANGRFTINTTAKDYKIVALTDDSTVDTSSGAVLSGFTLSAPKGASVVTPTTTLMEEGGMTAAEVAEVLGLPDGVDPLTFNPFKAGVDAATALAVEKVSQQLMTTVSSFASAAEGAGASEKGAFEAALKSVVDVIKVKAEKINDPNTSPADKKIDFTKTADLNLIKAKVADEAEKVAKAEGTSNFDKVAMANLVNDTTTSIKNVNDQIKDVKDLTSNATKNVFSTLQVLSEQVKAAAATEKINKGSGSISFTDPDKVKKEANNSAPKDLKLSATSIMEGLKDAVIGSLSSTDAEQATGFKYKIAKVEGTDHALFSINSKGELVLNGTADYSKKSSYKLFVTVTDAGGKTFSKEFSINVLNDPHNNITNNTIKLEGKNNLNGSQPVASIEDKLGPVLTDFSIQKTQLALGEKIKIEFEAIDDTHVGFLYATFSSVDNPSTKINIKGQNSKNVDKLFDYNEFFISSNNTYEMSIPLIIDGDLKSGQYVLQNIRLSDANKPTNSTVKNETDYSSQANNLDNIKIFNNLDQSTKELNIEIPVLNNNLGLPIINEQESNATLELANSVLPGKLIKGSVWPNGEDWFKFDVQSSGTIIAQLDMGNRSANLDLYSPNKTKILSEKVVEAEMVHFKTSDLGEYYLLVSDGNFNNSPYELIIDIV